MNKTPKPEPLLSEHQRYEEMTILRSGLVDAPYNPRTITDSARKNLKRVILKHGMVQPPVWNARTGRIVSGHQRISILDAIHGTKNYKIKVAKIDVDEKAEKELNLAMNNPSVTGDWDMPGLEKLLGEITIEDAGFNLSDVYKVFGVAPLMEDSEQVKAIADSLRGVKERHRKMQNKTASRNDIGYYRVLVFASVEHADRWSKQHGLDSREMFLQGDEFAKVKDAEETHT